VYSFVKRILEFSRVRNIIAIRACSIRRSKRRNPAAFRAALRHSKGFILAWFQGLSVLDRRVRITRPAAGNPRNTPEGE
jgi:hypothetical protein